MRQNIALLLIGVVVLAGIAGVLAMTMFNANNTTNNTTNISDDNNTTTTQKNITTDSDNQQAPSQGDDNADDETVPEKPKSNTEKPLVGDNNYPGRPP